MVEVSKSLLSDPSTMVEKQTHFDELVDVLASLDLANLQTLLTFVRETDGTLWVCGNGGSAANAIHWACDLSKVAGRRVQTLGVNPSVLTAWSNDTTYAGALAHELERIRQPGDRLICLSCSGTSMNILAVLRQAWLLKMPRAILTGGVWLGVTPVDVCVQVRSHDPAVIEDSHMAIGHWLTKKLQEEQ